MDDQSPRRDRPAPRQSDFGAFLSSLGDKRFDGGSIAVTGSGSYDGKTLTFSLKPRLNNLGLTRMYVPQGRRRRSGAPGRAGRRRGGDRRGAEHGFPRTDDAARARASGAGLLDGARPGRQLREDPSAGTRIVLTQLAGQDNKGWVTLGWPAGTSSWFHAGRPV